MEGPRLDEDERVVRPDPDGDDGGEDVHEGEELDAEDEGVDGVGQTKREHDAGRGGGGQEEALQGGGWMGEHDLRLIDLVKQIRNEIMEFAY